MTSILNIKQYNLSSPELSQSKKMAYALQSQACCLLVGLLCVSMVSMNPLPIESDDDIPLNFWRTENKYGKMESFHLKAKWDSHYLVGK